MGFLFTPKFGYLLGIYPLIIIIDKLNKLNHKINNYNLIKNGVLGICSMHFIGIFYTLIQILLFQEPEMFFYNISKYSLGKFGYHLLMLTLITIFTKIINKYKYQK